MFEFSSRLILPCHTLLKWLRKKRDLIDIMKLMLQLIMASFLIEVLFAIHILSKTTKVCIIRSHINSKKKIYRILVEFKDAELE